jgi:hypothetical protein
MKINLKVIATVFISSALSACGGGITVAGNGDGITGTGITAGRITEFGSIYVNGIKFNVDSAMFSRDGVTSTGQSDFSIGEYIVIKGSVDESDPTSPTGIAEEVIFEDLLEGVVTLESIDNLTIEVLGQLIEIDSNTKLLDERDSGASTFTFTNLTDLVVGNIVEISGFKDANDLIKATSIKLKKEIFESGSENELKGTVSNLDTSNQTFMISAILVDYSGADFDGFNKGDLTNDQFVEVKSISDIVGGTLVATEVELEDENLVVETGTELEMEGVVTRYVSDTDFDVSGIPVTTNSETEYHNGVATDIAENTPLEVKGKINTSGILVAEEIEFED